MSNDQRVSEAAERVRTAEAAERLRSTDPSNLFYWYSDAPNADSRVLAHAYLWEHRADDCEEITEAWLWSVGFVESQNSLRYQKWFVIPNCDGWSRAVQGPAYACEGPQCWRLSLWNWTERIKDNPARGDLRTLCRALGITLKETL